MRKPDPERENEEFAHLAWEMRWQVKRARKVAQDARRKLREQAQPQSKKRDDEERSFSRASKTDAD
jgi:hypothetical protein